MKKIKYILSIIIPLFVVIACVDDPDVYEFPVDKYYYDIPDVPVTEDYVIGVPYNIVDSGYWYNASTGLEELHTGHPADNGFTDNQYIMRNPDTRMPTSMLQRQLEWGKKAGIDFFMVSWGGRGWNDTLLTEWGRLYNQDNSYPKVVIRFDPGYMLDKVALKGVEGTNDTLQRDPLRMDSLRFDIDSVYQHIMTKPYIYKANNGKIVMSLTNFTNKYPAEIIDLKSFVNEFRTIGQDNLWIMGEIGGNWTSPENWGYRDESTKGVVKADTISFVDAVYITDVATGDYERYNGYFSFMDYNYNYWQQRMRPINKEYIPVIFPAFDNKVRDPNSGTYFIPRWKPETNIPYIVSDGAEYQESGVAIERNLSRFEENPYKTLGNVAKRNVGNTRIILVYSWNDFRNGNNLEPTKEFGEDYLNYTKQFFKK